MKISSDDCASIIRKIIPSDFRVNAHEITDIPGEPPKLLMRIRDLDSETYMRIEASLLEIPETGTRAEFDAALTEHLRPKVDEIVAALRAA